MKGEFIMDTITLEARILAAVHLNQLMNKSCDIKLPGLSEIRIEEFQEFIGVYHALVDHYKDVLEYMQPTN